MTNKKLAIIVKGYPRLSETFIAQEIHALEQNGFDITIFSLRHPTEQKLHPIHEIIRANIVYLPEYLHKAPIQLLKSILNACKNSNFPKLLGVFFRDFVRDPTPNRVRRFGQALILSQILNDDYSFIYCHFLHTPSSVGYYTAILRAKKWAIVHAKDIWTIKDWEKIEKIDSAEFITTCTHQGAMELQRLSKDKNKVHCIYHGLDLSRFPAPPARTDHGMIEILSVGRMVTKKGYDDLLKALLLLPKNMQVKLNLIGDGDKLAEYKKFCQKNGLSVHFLGRQAFPTVLEYYRKCGLFILPSKAGEAGDQDGLPNVLMEAASQECAIIATNFAGIPEFIEHGKTGSLVPAGDPPKIAQAIETLVNNPSLRQKLAAAARQELYNHFDSMIFIKKLVALLNDNV